MNLNASIRRRPRRFALPSTIFATDASARLSRHASGSVIPNCACRICQAETGLPIAALSQNSPRLEFFATTVTHPAAFRTYLLEQLCLLTDEYGATLEVGPGRQEIPFAYVAESPEELGQGGVTSEELARSFPVPLLSSVGDEIADGWWKFREGEPRPLALFDAIRVDYSLRRLVHYTGSDWRLVQPWILLTNYHRYVDQFIQWGLEQLRTGGPYKKLASARKCQRGCGLLARRSRGAGRLIALASLADARLPSQDG